MAFDKDIRFGLIGRMCPNTKGVDIRSVWTEAEMFQSELEEYFYWEWSNGCNRKGLIEDAKVHCYSNIWL
jgi:hypothetical protein